MLEILRTEENGVEFFTVATTGESGMSQRGLARACGVVHSTIQKLEKRVATKSAPKRLKRFEGKVLRVAPKINGLPIIYNVAFSSAVIKYYAYSGKEQAQDIDDAIGEIGLTSFIHSKTKYLPEQYKAAPEAHLKINQILDVPKKFHPLFGNERCNKIATFLRTSRGSIKMANWWIRFVYFNLSENDWAKLNRENPIINGSRKYAIHQWIDENFAQKYKELFDALLVIVDCVRDEYEFRLMFNRKFSGQQSIFGISDFASE